MQRSSPMSQSQICSRSKSTDRQYLPSALYHDKRNAVLRKGYFVMRSTLLHINTIFLVALLALFIGGCSQGEEGTKQAPKSANSKLEVTATILPVATFTEKVGGNRVKVTTLIPPGASPHTFEPTPKQLIGISNAQALVVVGSGVEFEMTWLNKLVDMNRSMALIDTSKGIVLHGEEVKDDHDEHGGHDGHNDHDEHGGHESHDHHGQDPHIWVSVRNAQKMVDNIATGLIKIDPEGKDHYTERANSYIEELKTLDKRIAETVEGMENKKFLVYHPSWGYFARDYNLTQVAIERGGREATPRTVVELVRTAKEEGIKVIIASPEFSSRSAEVIADEIEGRVIMLSPLEKDYTGNIERLARTLEGE